MEKKINVAPIIENSQSLFHKISQEFNKISFTDAELVQIFNIKYKNTDILQLFDEHGKPISNKDGVSVDLIDTNISDSDKAKHISGYIYNLKDSKTSYVKNLAQEKEILEIAESKGSELKSLIVEYMKDFKEEK